MQYGNVMAKWARDVMNGMDSVSEDLGYPFSSGYCHGYAYEVAKDGWEIKNNNNTHHKQNLIQNNLNLVGGSF